MTGIFEAIDTIELCERNKSVSCGDSAHFSSDSCLRIVDDDGHPLTSGDHLVMAANDFVFAPDGQTRH